MTPHTPAPDAPDLFPETPDVQEGRADAWHPDAWPHSGAEQPEQSAKAALKRFLRRASRVPALRPAARRLAPAARRASRTWRRSLQLRMVSITLLASGLLVGGFGYLIVERSTQALIHGAEQDALQRLKAGRAHAESQLSVRSRPNDPGVADDVGTILAALASRPEQGSPIIVAMRSYDDDTLDTNGIIAGGRVDVRAAISDELEQQVAVKGLVAHQIVHIDPADPDQPAGTYLVYGSPVPTKWGGQLQLYYLIPLDTEVSTAQDFQATVTFVGAALVLLLSLVVALVTRAVVQPVRLAAQTAQRLSAGLLDQRMQVRGEDDLALLADAFNQMAANLQRQIVRLEDMSRLQRRFTSDVSHELRTPLTTVRMAADLIHSEREGFDPAVARSAELLQNELDRFEELLSDLLEISRFDAGFAMLEEEPTDLVTIVMRVCDRLEPVAERVGIDLEVVAPPPPVIAEVDPRRVERVLRNLVGNAIDHGEGRPVVVTLAVDEHAVAITVRDHGVGLKPAEEKLVFNRFWRADPSRARQTGGTGLGLSISIEDARLHGGWLQAWGAPGQGAQFRLTLPVRAGARLTASPLPLIPVDIPSAEAGPQLPTQSRKSSTEVTA